MILKLKYFGMITEALGKESEELELDVHSAADLTSHFQNLLKEINFKVAVNQKLVEPNFELSNNDEVALLPPFAGG